MRRFLWSWTAPVLLALCCGLASAQDDTKDLHPYKGSGNAPAVQLAPNDPGGEKPEKPAPTLAYAVAVLLTIVVLSLICVPSRKSESSTSR
jgi:hypothetical protein